MIYSFPKRAAWALACVGLLGLSSCEQMLRDMATKSSSGQQQRADSTSATASADTLSGTSAKAKEPEFEITYPKGSKYAGLTPPAGAKKNPFEEIPAIIELHKDKANWADKHADIKGVLLQNSQKDYLFVLQQQGANEMLRRELFPHYYQDMNNASVLNTIGFYTEQLLEAKSEDSELMYKCLRALKGHWSEKQIAKAALTTAQRVQARPIASPADTTTRNGSYRQVYARELKKMANRLSENS
ncbi:hypothetical protein [Rufibacter tibetensis]|uniref:Uncharacterized protein n=1 Tax=Rufibacter tibetensis TaxID=512763 RepID=A0A0N7HW98_9BACT|nr:hypothetical protein [Rufibacter tibetensis]ALI98648.1 hypothetical protein DC20_06290 [Rufibacter tibetensis]